MRFHLFLLAISMALFSCSADMPVPCETGTASAGQLCSEYRYINAEPVGHVAFGYEGDTVSVSDFFDNHSCWKKTVTRRSENGQVSLIAEQFPDRPSQVQSWHYNDIDSLDMILYGANDSLLNWTYENSRRTYCLAYHGATLVRYSHYRYYQDDGNLYRITDYAANDSITGYRTYDYFDDGTVRIKYFTHDNRIIGIQVFRPFAPGLPSSITFTDSTGTVTRQTDFSYDSGNNLTESNSKGIHDSFRSIFLYY